MNQKGVVPWSELTVAQQDERDLWLRGTLSAFDPLYARLGSLRQAFMDAFYASGCREITDQFMADPVARFRSHLEIDGFQNENIFGDRALRQGDLARIFATINHERKHAIQFNEVAALHATPFNPKTRIVLAPADELCIMEAKEADAMSWAWLLQQIVDGKISATDPAAQEQALQGHVRHVLETEIINDSTGLTALTYYRDLALSQYESILAARRQQYGPGGLVFVRLGVDDLAAFGASIGLRSFAGHFETPPLLHRQSIRLAAMNAINGVLVDRPTLSQALAETGQTQSSFMALSRTPPAHIHTRNAGQGFAAAQQIQLTYQ